MLKKIKNKKAQNTAEYAILIALVIGGVVAMQTYAQRTMQARLRDANHKLVDETLQIGGTQQYEPYYSNTYAQNDKISETDETGEGQTRSINTQKKGSYYDRTEYQGPKGF